MKDLTPTHRDHMLIKPTELGQRFLNDLQQMFLGEDF